MKHKFLKCFFVFLSLFVILVTFSLSAFAKDQPMFSPGASFDVNYIYSGNTDIMLTVALQDTYSGDFFNLSTPLNPSISSDMVSGDAVSYFDMDSVAVGDFYSPLVTGYYDTFRASDHYFDFGIVTDNSFFASNFSLNYQVNDSDYLINSVQVSARDFYIYLDPNGDVSVSDYDEYFFAESFLLLNHRSFYDYSSATGTIFYCLAGQEDNANNRLTYNYSLPSNSGSYSQFYTLPMDQSFSGTYSEPTLIYVEYFSLNIPFNQSVYLDGSSITGTYFNYNMDYRSIDLSSSSSSNVDPITPINPGVFRDYTGWLGTAVGGFLDLQIVDGFTLGGILMVIIAFMITMWFLKVFAGG